ARGLRRSCGLHRCSDRGRMGRPVLRAGIAPAEDPNLSTARCDRNPGMALERRHLLRGGLTAVDPLRRDTLFDRRMGMATRPLTQDEIALARRVFQDNLPYKKIRIADDLGLGDAPWTDPFGAFFTIHMGPTAFGVGTSTTATAAYTAAKLDET